MDLSPLNSISANLPSDLTGLEVRKAQTPAAQRTAVAGQFEAILLRQFLTQSVGSMLGGDKDAQSSVYSYFLTDSLAQKLSAGGGMGLSKMLAQQLAPAGTKIPEAAHASSLESPSSSIQTSKPLAALSAAPQAEKQKP